MCLLGFKAAGIFNWCLSMEAITSFPQDRSPEKMDSPINPKKSPVGVAPSKEFRMQLNKRLLEVCQEQLAYISFVHITGRLAFNLDNREVIHMAVSETGAPTAFPSSPQSLGTDPELEIQGTREKPVPVFFRAGSSQAGTKRKRGRPPKAQTLAARKAANKTKKALVKLHRIPDSAVTMKLSPEQRNLPEDISVQDPNTVSLVDPEYIKQEQSSVDEAEDGTVAAEDLQDASKSELGNGTHLQVNADAECFDAIAEQEGASGAMIKDAPGEGQEAASRTDQDGEEQGDDDESAEAFDNIKDPDFVPADSDDSGAAEAPYDDDDDDDDMDHSEAEEINGEEDDKTWTAKPSKAKLKGKTHKCPHCDFVTDHTGHLRVHIQRHTGERNEKCPNCDKTFINSEDVTRHIRTVHNRRLTCSHCKEEFTSIRPLKQHLREKHGVEGKIYIHSCKVCKKKFHDNNDLKEHMNSTHNHICSICGESFKKAMFLNSHRLKTHPESALKCDICKQHLSTPGALRKHVKRHKEIRQTIQCDECGKSFMDKSSLYHHKKGIHTTERRFKCDRCGEAFNFSNSLKLHLLKHQGLRPFKCSVCSKSYLTSSHLKSHMHAVHAQEKRYSCPVCNKQFPYDNSLRMHMMLHTGDRPFMCCICSKGFVSRQALKVHEATHVEGKKHECDICHKMYKTEMLMRAHRRRHTEDGSRYMCDICGAQFMFKSNLEAHYPVHNDKRTYKCNICDKMFKTYPSLYSHKLVHMDDTPHSCQVCGKGFKTRERLRAHEQRHLGLKPFTCSQCGNSFPDKGGLAKHKKTVHSSKVRFACPVCGKGCNRADNLRVHMKVHRDPALLKLPIEELMAVGSQGGQNQNDMATSDQVDHDLDVRYRRRKAGRPRITRLNKPDEVQNSQEEIPVTSEAAQQSFTTDDPSNTTFQSTTSFTTLPEPLRPVHVVPLAFNEADQMGGQNLSATQAHPTIASVLDISNTIPHTHINLQAQVQAQSQVQADVQAQVQAQADGAVALAQLSTQPPTAAAAGTQISQIASSLLYMQQYQNFMNAGNAGTEPEPQHREHQFQTL